MTTTIFIADGHRLVRHGLRLILQTRPDFVVVGEASDGEEAAEGVRATKPDVLLLEISMPRTSGIETIRWIRDSGCATRCLVVSAHERAGHVTEALRAGAAGYVVKTAGPDELLTAVEAVRAGRLFLSPSIADWVVTDLIERKEPASILTPREREVLQLIAEGYSSREMAARLGVSAKTVESHRFNIMSKMKVRKSSQLVRVAIQEGLVAP